jgi:phosphoribosylformylglycinamidine cyclo-ligase
MTTYKESGVDISAGNKASKIAALISKGTHNNRESCFGKPVTCKNDFTGLIDMGDFYITQNSDGIGSKIKVAEKMNEYSFLGYDLLAMVADDNVCCGAETIAITNIIDTDRVMPEIVHSMMSGLSVACSPNRVVISGGEIAELPTIVNGISWNASSIGLVKKNHLITGEDIKKGDAIIGIPSDGLRSNGFTLVSHILEKNFGKNWHLKKFPNKDSTWGMEVLKPSTIYSNAILSLVGRYNSNRPFDGIKGIAHITGGGILGNIKRALGNHAAVIDNLPEVPGVMRHLQKLGNVSTLEAYSTWNMGVGMILILPYKDSIQIMKNLSFNYGLECQVIGEVKNKSSFTVEPELVVNGTDSVTINIY